VVSGQLDSIEMDALREWVDSERQVLEVLRMTRHRKSPTAVFCISDDFSQEKRKANLEFIPRKFQLESFKLARSGKNIIPVCNVTHMGVSYTFLFSWDIFVNWSDPE